ncbi:MAG: hypothetical protein KBD64_03775 [Gammaproteobacteria bacterium]|nr:hypothetical protein [Gammaproteobacteria bacterium]
MKSKSLVQSWLEVELNINGKTLTEALAALNSKMDSSHTHSRVNEWKENRNGRGERLPRELRMHMAKLVMKDVLESAGVNTSKLSKKVLNKIAEQLS